MKISAIAVIVATLAVLSVQSVDALNANRVLCLINKERARYGRPALALDPDLMHASQSYSDKQASTETMSHTLFGKSFGDRVHSFLSKFGLGNIAENIAAGQPTEDAVVNSWIKSPGHHANILSNQTHFGIGEDIGEDGKPYWTQLFGNDGQSHNFPLCPSESAPIPAPAPAPSTPAPAPYVPATPTLTPAVSHPTNHRYHKKQHSHMKHHCHCKCHSQQSTKHHKCHHKHKPAHLPKKCGCKHGRSKCSANGQLSVCRHGRWEKSTCPNGKQCKIDSPLKACCA